MAAWNLQNKGKQTNRYREQTEGLWVEVEVGQGGRSGVLDGKGGDMKKCQLPAREMVAGMRGTARGMQSVSHAARAASGVGRGLNSPEGSLPKVCERPITTCCTPETNDDSVCQL